MEERSPPGGRRRKISLATSRSLSFKAPTPPKGTSVHFPKKPRLKVHASSVGGGLISRGPWVGTKRITFNDKVASGFYSTAGDLYICNDIDPGTAPDQRIGRQVRVRGIAFCVCNYMSSGAGTTRTIIFVDKHPKPPPATPTYAELWENASLIVAPNLDYQIVSQYNLDNLDTKYDILYDRLDTLFQLNDGDGTNDRFFLPVDILTTYGSVGNVPITNQLYLYLIGDNTSASHGKFQITIYFTDE